jgi:hypothetical protein
MKKRFLFAALGVAAALFVFAGNSAKADHFRGGYGAGYGGYHRGEIGISPIYPGYGYDRGYRGGFRRGHDRCRPPVPPPCPRRGYYGGYQNNINLLTPDLNLGIRY